ncbi:Arylesterase [Colletotrichum trifolii]|uniref:Arylesterase n=1 Tax=Colletotrichum trifolii TaxID=5466 RepID=A0A4R8Q4X6_COLTR|nr:Arylesterase [Colletotrichum trifolii]
MTVSSQSKQNPTPKPSPGRLAFSAEDYPGIDPEWVRLWNEHGGSMVRADEVSIAEYRKSPAQYGFTHPTHSGPEVFHVKDCQIPVTRPAGKINVSIYSPEGPGPFPVHLNFHGGKLSPMISISNKIPAKQPGAATSATNPNIKVIDVDYRMGPEHKFPAAIYDCWDAVKWAIKSASHLNIDPSSVSFGGLSAGGQMSAVLAHFARDEGIPSTHWILTPVLAPNFENLPPAHVVTAEFDLERDEEEYYGNLLRQAGNKVTMKRYAGVPHAFAHYNHPERGLSKSFEFIEDTTELLRVVHYGE